MSATGRFRASMEFWARSPASKSRNWPFTKTARQDCALDEGMGLPVPQVTTVILDGSSNSARRRSEIDCRCDAVDSSIEAMGPGGILHTASGAGGVSPTSTSPGLQVDSLSTSRESAPPLQPDAKITNGRKMPTIPEVLVKDDMFIGQRFLALHAEGDISVPVVMLIGLTEALQWIASYYLATPLNCGIR